MMNFQDHIKKAVISDRRVESIEFVWGQNQRPLKAAMSHMPPNYQIKWIDRFSPFEALASEWALAKAYEIELGVKVPLRAEYIRSLLSELQRLIWYFNYLKNVFTAIDDETRVQQTLRLREYLFQSQEIFTGSRILPQSLVIGGVERDFSVGDTKKFKDLLKNIEFEIRLFYRGLLEESLFSERLRGVLPVTEKQVNDWELGGVIAQAAGCGVDLRVISPYGAYDSAAIKYFACGVEKNSKNDALARVQAVLFQIRQTINICYQFLLSIPEGAPRVEVKDIGKVMTSEASIEGGSGPVTVRINKGAVSVETTSTKLAPHLEKLFEGVAFEDIELGFASLGFSFEEADVKW